ncbi:hypothetical protein ACFRAR_27335 [Kitasatospora sp. NPDC056651]|uniref:hypothetical protein n=1 Tax=Kitasatospora sp. NPDC056651 TaxID=3345892 RepID=UPI00367D587D
MSGRIRRDDQGRWRDQRGRGTRGPNRVPRHPAMPLPDELPSAEEGREGREDEAPPPPSGGAKPPQDLLPDPSQDPPQDPPT